MSRLFNIVTVAILFTCGSVASADEDDLFSDVKTKSVFEDETKTSGAAISTTRITSAEELRDLLKAAGFEAKVASSRAVSLEKKLDPWTFPVLMVISEDEKQVDIMLGLATIKDVTKELPVTTLLKMMTASQENAHMLFSYHAKRERTEVSQVIRNQSLTGLMLRDAVNKMALLAKQTSGVWSTSTNESTVVTDAKVESPAPATPQPATAAPNLAGKWSAARSATEAFAVELKSTGTFNLVYINAGKQTKSSGKFTAKDGSLSLIGSNGLKLEGKLTVQSATEFTFAPANGKELVFTTAK